MTRGSHRSQLTRRDFIDYSIVGATSVGTGKHISSFTSDSVSQIPEEARDDNKRRQMVLRSWRTLESGFHNGPTVTFDRLDPERYMESVRKAHTQVVVVQTKSHWGYAYYDTTVGVRHPNLHYDLINRWVTAAHRNGLAVVAYYSGQVDTQSGIKYPYWVGKNADGSASWIGRRFAWCCHNSPYRHYALEMYQEIFDSYAFDGLFIDGLPWPRWLPDPLCYCDWCMKRYEEDQNESFLKHIDGPAEYYKRLTWLQNSSLRYLDEIYRVVHSRRPGLPIWFNQADPFDTSALTLIKAASPYMEPMSSPSGVAVGAIVLRDSGYPEPQAGIFWSGYVDTPIEVDRFRTASVIMHAVRPRFITDQQNMPNGRQRPGFYRWCATLQRYSEQMESLLQNVTPMTCLGVLFSEGTKGYLASQRRDALEGPHDFRDSISGCLDIFTRTHYPIGIVTEATLNSDQIQQYALIALPETDALSDSQVHTLKGYVQRGGKLLATWKPGLIDEHGRERGNFGLGEALGVSYVREVTKYSAKDGPGIYLHSAGHPLSQSLGLGTVGILTASRHRDPQYCPFVRVQGPAENLANYCLPYRVPHLDKHIFDSWNSAPPGSIRISQAATFYRFGHGEAVYVGLPLFRRYDSQMYWIDTFVRSLINQLIPEPPIRVQGESGIQASFFRQGPNRIIVQLLNGSVWTTKSVSTVGPTVNVIGRTDLLSVRHAKLLWPKDRRLDLITDSTHWRVPVPNVVLHAIVEIQLAPSH